MVNVTVNVSDELKRKMEKHKRINWSEVARSAFEEEIRQVEMVMAAEGIKRLRGESRAPGWSGAREIRKWRNASK